MGQIILSLPRKKSKKNRGYSCLTGDDWAAVIDSLLKALGKEIGNAAWKGFGAVLFKSSARL
jgi:hypothetical protein